MLWYLLEVPLWGTSNEYPQDMFLWWKRVKYVVALVYLKLRLKNISFPWEENWSRHEERVLIASADNEGPGQPV